MDFFLPVTLEELKNLSDQEIVNRINANIAPKVSGSTMISFPDFVSAQFYMGELDRREKRRADKERDEIETKRWKIDFYIDALIVVLIVFEIIAAIGLAIWGDQRQTEDVKKQLTAFGDMQTVLSQLQQSSKATAATLGALQKTTEEMNGRIGRQLSMSFEPSVVANYNTSNGMVEIVNAGSTLISIYGFVSGNYDVKFPKPLVILAHTQGQLNDGPFYSQQREKINTGGQNFDFTIFFRAENDDEYTLNAELNMQHFSPAPFFVQVINQKVVRNNWGPRYRKGKTWN
jgi:type II secretory pathway pseudopilin PulG